MKPSRFNLVIPAGGEYLIYNTFTGAQAMVDEKSLKAIQGLPDLRGVPIDPPPPYSSPLEGEGRVGGIEELHLLDEIKGIGITVDDEVDEGLELEYWFQRIKFDTSLLNITILTTYACNLSCTYCYEEGVGSKASLDPEMTEGIIKWIKERVDYVRPRELRINFFGGEPLMNKAAIKDISSLLKGYTEEKGIELSTWVITNGVLLDKEFVKEIVPLGLKRIKVTLDGVKEVHDARRRYKNGMGTFDIIMENLKEIAGLVPISIGGNYDDETKRGIPALLDRLVQSGLRDHIADIRFKPIFGHPGDSSCNPCAFSETDPADMVWIKEEIVARGFATRGDIAIGPCDAIRENSFTIDPLGRIYKCPGFVGREEFIIGDINRDGLYHRNTEFMTTDLWRVCADCAYVPICAGGCRVSAYLSKGDFKKGVCERRYLEGIAMGMVKEVEAEVKV